MAERFAGRPCIWQKSDLWGIRGSGTLGRARDSSKAARPRGGRTVRLRSVLIIL